jgi:hypothetical protein
MPVSLSGTPCAGSALALGGSAVSVLALGGGAALATTLIGALAPVVAGGRPGSTCAGRVSAHAKREHASSRSRVCRTQRG